jgi:hypothetical protein
MLVRASGGWFLALRTAGHWGDTDPYWSRGHCSGDRSARSATTQLLSATMVSSCRGDSDAAYHVFIPRFARTHSAKVPPKSFHISLSARSILRSSEPPTIESGFRSRGVGEANFWRRMKRVLTRLRPHRPNGRQSNSSAISIANSFRQQAAAAQRHWTDFWSHSKNSSEN